MSAAPGSVAPFAVRTIAILVVVGVAGFLSFMLLSAYAPDFRPIRNGGAHAFSTSAVGFAGAAELVESVHGKAGIIRDQRMLGTQDLVVLTPGPETSAEELKKVVDLRGGQLTVIVLPKWVVATLPSNRAWVQAVGQWTPVGLSLLLGKVTDATIVDAPPGHLRSIQGKNLKTMIATPEGGALLAEVGDSGTLILADPDALDNLGLATPEGATKAMEMLDAYTPEGRGVSFDVTLAGFGRSPNLLKLAVEPPFLPLTLCLLAAMFLAGLHATRRFGPAAHEARAVAFGKRAIAENGAALFRLAKRRHRTGGRYAALTREAVAAATGAPSGLGAEALDRYIDRLDPTGEPFSSIAARAADAKDTRRLLAAARDLYLWRRTVTREH